MFNARVFVGTMFAASFAITVHATEPVATDAASAPPAAQPVAPPPNIAKPVLANLNPCKPTYPIVSLQFEEQGTVRLQFKIGADSQLISTKVLKSSGYSKLDNAAVEALSHCRFKAAMKDGVPIEATLAVDYVWELNTPYPRSTVKLGDLPLNKRYYELSDAEKLNLRSMFDKLPDADEPPYPINGLQEIVELIHDVENMRMVAGKLALDVEIDANGRPQGVTVRNSPDRQLTRYATNILMSATYKPAKCDGTPCKMSFPFNFELAIVH
jgi:TonB family protein